MGDFHLDPYYQLSKTEEPRARNRFTAEMAAIWLSPVLGAGCGLNMAYLT
jgi:hypothetical protein